MWRRRLNELLAQLRSFAERAELVKPTAEVEFLPAALEIIETPPSPVGRGMAAMIIAFFVIALLWACFGEVDIIATAPGKIVPTGRTKTIQPFETGVVRAIRVQDGQKVKAGDILVEIDPTINEAERARLAKDLMRARLDAARLKAALAMLDDPGASFAPPQDAAPEQVTMHRALLANQLDEIGSRLKTIDQQLLKTEANRAAVQSTIDKIARALPLIGKRASIRSYLARKEYGSKIAALSGEQELIEQQQELKVQQDRLAEAMAEIAMLEQQRRQAGAEFRSRTLAELTKAEHDAASLDEQLLQAAQRYKLQTLRAPIGGTVQQLAIHTEGGVVTTAQALMAIVPEDSGLEIEAAISNRDIGFVHEGQEAAIKVDTFNFTRYGLIGGRVEAVSQDAVVRSRPVERGGGAGDAGAESASSEPAGQEYVYVARVSMAQTHMEVDERRMRLTPGMAVTVEVKTGRRKLIEFLLSPLVRHSQQALRER